MGLCLCALLCTIFFFIFRSAREKEAASKGWVLQNEKEVRVGEAQIDLDALHLHLA